LVVLGIYALSGSPVAQKRPCSTANACVVLIAIIFASITMQNPEVEVRYGAIMGAPHQTMHLFFGWLEQSVPTAEFDEIVAATSKAFNSTSISDGPLFPISCVAKELRDGSSATNSCCDNYEGFAFNLIIGHAFLLSTATSSGLSCRRCMASWLLSQLSSMFLLIAHSAPSLTLRCYSVASFMLLSFTLCLSVSKWKERQAKKEELDCIGCRSPEGEVQKMKESEYQSRNRIKLECCTGMESTCTPEHGVLVSDGGVGFTEVKAADLEIGATGATALIFDPSGETMKAVTVEVSSDRVASMGRECKNSFLFSAKPMNDKAIAAMLPMIKFDRAWGEVDVSHDSSSFSSIASRARTPTSNLDPDWSRTWQDLALSDVTRIPKGADGQLYSHGSEHHPRNCTPCLFLDSAKGCADEVLCTRCHYPHPGRPKSYKKRTVHRKRNMSQPVQETREEPAMHVTVENTFVE